MIDSSRGYRESNSSSSDLMARFDMAHDRADRLPEVRAYLENLRPQILKLQKELKLQTEEDIAGLDRRDDLNMNDVDVLVDLIKAFRKAWTENKIPVDRRLREKDELAFEKAADGFTEFKALYKQAFGEPTGRREDMLAFVRAMARAGEPKLAWNCYKRVSDDGSLYPSEVLTALMPIYEGFSKRGETPPFESGQMTALMEDTTKWNGDPSGRRNISQLGLRLVRLLAASGKSEEILKVVQSMRMPALKLQGLMIAKEHGVAKAHYEIERFLDRLSDQSYSDEVACWAVFGNDAKAIEKYAEARSKVPGDLCSVDVVAPLVRSGFAERAFEILDAMASATHHGQMVGKMAVEFFRLGDDANAQRVLLMPQTELAHLDAEDAPRILAEFLRRDWISLSVGLEHEFASPKGADEDGRAEALQKMACMFAEQGIDPWETLRAMRQSAREAPRSARESFQSSLAETRAAVALRTFKRAARIFGLRWSHPAGTFDRAAWESKMKNVLDAVPEIAKELTYDEPIE